MLHGAAQPPGPVEPARPLLPPCAESLLLPLGLPDIFNKVDSLSVMEIRGIQM